MSKHSEGSGRETQRQSAARMSVQRIAETSRKQIKKFHLEIDPKTGRQKR